MIKAILMDVGRTIVTNRIIDFKKGLKAVYDLDENKEKIDFTKYLEVNQALWKISYDVARKTCTEVPIDEYLQVLCEITGLNVNLEKKELEWFFQCNLIEEELIDGVTKFLEYVNSKNIPIIAVSNSCMTSYPISREFQEFGILKYFKEVISSADILIRKPRKEIFDYAYGKLLKIDNSIQKQEVLFIGNDYNCDVVGSANAGLVPVWFNEKQEEAKENSFSFINVNSYSELINTLKIINNDK